MNQSPSTAGCPSSEVKSARKKHKRGSVFTVNEKNIVIKVYNYVQDTEASTNPSKPVYKTDLADKTANILGIGVASVYRIVKEYKKEGKPSIPNHTRKRITISEKIDDFTKSVIRRKVHSFFLNGDLPTLNKMLKAVNEDETLPNLKRTTLYCLLKELKFKYMKRQRRREDITLWRRKYLDKMKSCREEHQLIYDLDETAVNESDQSDSSAFTDQDESLASFFVSKLTESIDIRSSSEVLYCTLCLKEITRFRYICLVCSQQEWCGGCEARGGQHDDHYVLRVPTRRPLGEVSAVESAILAALASLPIWKKAFTVNSKPAVETRKKVRTKKKAALLDTTEGKEESMRNESTESIEKETECTAETRYRTNKLNKTVDEVTIKKKRPSRNEISTTKRRRSRASEITNETNEVMDKSRTKNPASKLKIRKRTKTTMNLPNMDKPITTIDVLVNKANESGDELSKEPRTRKKPLSGKRLKTVENATRNTQSRDKQSEPINEHNKAKQDLMDSDEEPEVKVEYLIKDELDPLDEEALQTDPSVRSLDSHVVLPLSQVAAPPSKRELCDDLDIS